MAIDYDAAKAELVAAFTESSATLLAGGTPPAIDDSISEAIETLFSSRTQAYREALVGCILARLQDKSIDIRLPYRNLGENSWQGRGVDEFVVNPFLHEQSIPSSRGPYLSVFRRSVTFNEATRSGVRDKAGYDAFLVCLTHLESLEDDDEIREFLKHLMYRFAELREAANVTLTRIQRLSLDQYGNLIDRLLGTQSGGRFPLVLTVAIFRAIVERFSLPWSIDSQGINVADSQSGAGGDVTIKLGEKVILAAEITERKVDRARVVSTFRTKIGPNGIEDYMFLTTVEPDEDAKARAHQLFAQGHEVNFVNIRDWVVMVLATLGNEGRAIFNRELVSLLDNVDFPKALKVAWNEHVQAVIGA